MMSYRADKQVIATHTQGHTDPQAQAITIPEGQNWQRVIQSYINVISLFLSGIIYDESSLNTDKTFAADHNWYDVSLQRQGLTVQGLIRLPKFIIPPL